jgi:hypothetical protein
MMLGRMKMYMSGDSLLIILGRPRRRMASGPNRARNWLRTHWRLGNRSYRRIHWRLATAATRYPRWIGHYFSDHRCHHRRHDALTGPKIGSGRKRMASKIGKGLEQTLVEQGPARWFAVGGCMDPDGVRHVFQTRWSEACISDTPSSVPVLLPRQY